MQSPINISDYTYDLPEERIAKFPLANRDDSKLLVFYEGAIRDHVFRDAVHLIPENSLLIFNNTKVVQARLLFEKTTGARPIEVFCLEPAQMDVESAMAAQGEVSFYALVGNAKRWKDGIVLSRLLPDGVQLTAHKVGREGESFVVRFSWNGGLSFSEILEEAGKVPLPPYLKRDVADGDRERYQTVYAQTDGSVAAPTAGLHFTDEIISSIRQKGVQIAETTLHVGAGTFKPVSTEDVRDHDMHAEEIHITRSFLQTLVDAAGPIICVGTTSTRTLESVYWLGVKVLDHPQIRLKDLYLAQWDAYELSQEISLADALHALVLRMDAEKTTHFFTRTQLIIAPGYQFRVISGLFTNFHQPGSTLILLVAAAIGAKWRNVYNHALANNYRFLSYGDSSLLFIPPENRAQY